MPGRRPGRAERTAYLRALPVAADAWAAQEAGGLSFEDFLARDGCLRVGRRTYDVVAGLVAPWPWGVTTASRNDVPH